MYELVNSLLFLIIYYVIRVFVLIYLSNINELYYQCSLLSYLFYFIKQLRLVLNVVNKIIYLSKGVFELYKFNWLKKN